MSRKKWSLAQLATAANIAAKMANEGRSSNPLFTQALLELERMFKEGKLVSNKSGVYLKIPVDGPDFSRRSEQRPNKQTGPQNAKQSKRE